MRKVTVIEEWPEYSGRRMFKEHLVLGTVRTQHSELKNIETYTYISKESLPTQLKTIALFKEATTLLIKDGQGKYQVWFYFPETDSYARSLIEEEDFLPWCIHRLGGDLIREYLSATFYDNTLYMVAQIGHTNTCNINLPVTVCSQFNISSPVSNRYNLAKYSNNIERYGSVYNSDGVLREYKTNIYSQGYGRLKADTGLFVYLPVDKILKPNTIYNVTSMMEEYNLFNTIPPFKSNKKEYRHEY